MNTCEFAIRNGVPVAIDFMNWTPDCARTSVGDENFQWIVEHAARMLRPAAPRPDGEDAAEPTPGS